MLVRITEEDDERSKTADSGTRRNSLVYIRYRFAIVLYHSTWWFAWSWCVHVVFVYIDLRTTEVAQVLGGKA